MAAQTLAAPQVAPTSQPAMTMMHLSMNMVLESFISVIRSISNIHNLFFSSLSDWLTSHWSIFSGNIRQPKYGHLKDLHNVLKSMEKILLHGDYKDTTMGNKNVTVINIPSTYIPTQNILVFLIVILLIFIHLIHIYLHVGDQVHVGQFLGLLHQQQVR